MGWNMGRRRVSPKNAVHSRCIDGPLSANAPIPAHDFPRHIALGMARLEEREEGGMTHVHRSLEDIVIPCS